MPKPMIERIARALCTFDGHPENIQFEGNPMWMSYAGQARAVLTAMREPTEAVMDAGVKAHVSEDFANMGCIRVWQAEIDAALAEQ